MAGTNVVRTNYEIGNNIGALDRNRHNGATDGGDGAPRPALDSFVGGFRRALDALIAGTKNTPLIVMGMPP